MLKGSELESSKAIAQPIVAATYHFSYPYGADLKPGPQMLVSVGYF